MLEWLKGKKTYITAILAGVFNFGVAVGWWPLDNQVWVSINALLASFGLGFLRAGVNK
jgi:hypothetical protein